MIVVVTGGIGSGKSTVARLLAEHGASVIDYDQVAREAVEPGTPALAQIVAQWGSDVIGRFGALDRATLARRVFADPLQLQQLNSIVHPRIGQIVAKRESAILEADPGAIIVREVPLYTPDSFAATGVDFVVAVSVPENARIARLVEQRGMSESDARARIANQLRDEEREVFSDVVIHNDGNLDALVEQVDTLWAWLRREQGRSPHTDVGE
ncbi:dephospho-CoA kinase [Arcanobacterium wilhelmae]|uniref:Dephospho-CoA kinase n=1 Tax=Arcanobacterium wilhelmae TaxID=1803177 RepID=A0ABT9N8W7_9ACTO|nr:dephospho-CoA kinase [Arcanobacterium wilhelmae]MDP9799983.1 dephospho-CoA kinase [Arcanobacterium wilhelmae]WFN89484.1 dephospho-CoA kinase [Arcanobacterium wilhelmae]